MRSCAPTRQRSAFLHFQVGVEAEVELETVTLYTLKYLTYANNVLINLVPQHL